LDPDRETHIEIALTQDPALHIDVQLVPLRAVSDEQPGFLIVARDITSRRLAQSALEEANERLREHVREIERLQGELREQANSDALTGLYNRRHLDEMLPRILERAGRGGLPVSAILIDLDHFKAVNDRHGHEAGDALLEEIGRQLAVRTRPEDIACRYGGEEFALILPHTPLAVALERAESIRAAFRAVRIAEIAADPPPTLSAGIAVFPEHGITQDALLRAADRALYCAKEAGRDCVRVAGEKSA
jgi:diguanylate cyclase (GGDEF)-like protein